MNQDIQIGKAQRIGPLEVWPLRWHGLSEQKYQGPPFTSELGFEEYDTGDGPSVGHISVENLTDTDFIIPSGWVVGADLLQVRSFNSFEYVPAGESVLAEVSCVEKGRWADGSNRVDAGRAPISVVAAGWDYEPARARWVINASERQSRVWTQVSRQESRSGIRPTNSLEQVMREDSVSDMEVSKVQREIQSSFTTFDGQNGMLVALDGEPLMIEVYSDEQASRKILRETLRSISFDSVGTSYRALDRPQVQEFIENSEIQGMHMLSEEDWAVLMAGGNERIDTRGAMSMDGRLIQVSAINRNHRILLEV
jgi:hypothetical protein